MCKCTHGMDRHYLDYAGPGVPGGIPSKCLEPDCSCKLYTPVVENSLQTVQLIPTVQQFTTFYYFQTWKY